MLEIRRRRLEGAVWIPLRASSRTDEAGEFGRAGYKSVFYGVGTLAVAVGAKAEVTVAAAPGAASVRVWEVMSRGRRPRVGRPLPEGVDVDYPLMECAHRRTDL